MYYTQFLRVTCGLKWLAIVQLGLMALIVLIAGANGAFSHQIHSTRHTDIPLPALFAIAAFFASGFAARYARTLSEENEAHLPVAWTKPVSRVRYALTTIGVDAIGILASFALTLGVIFLFLAIFGATPYVAVTPDTPMQLLRYLALPFAFYGLLTALTASFGKAGRGIIGWGLLFSFIMALFSNFDLPAPWKTIVTAINYVNPLSYSSYQHTSGNDTVNVMAGPHGSTFTTLALTFDFAALTVLCVAGLVAGIYLWRRVEA